MTAIAGLWRWDGSHGALEGCRRMLCAQEIYGASPAATWDGGQVALGRRLTPLLAEDRFDLGPVIGGAGRFSMVADVRLDNRDELEPALGAGRDTSDSALLMLAYERWGDAFVDHLLGDYAVVIWDSRQRRLVLARDPIGQRPLHYHRGRGIIAVASMPTGLHALAEIPRAVDEQRLAEFVALAPASDGARTFFADIDRVEPGRQIRIDASGVTVISRWSPRRDRLHLGRPQAYAEGLAHELDLAVRRRLRDADGVGSQLSAGLDSSAVTTSAAALLSAQGRRLTAFTAAPRAGYDALNGRLVDETSLAGATAALHQNIDHVVVRSGPFSPLDEIERSAALCGRPPFNPCNLGWLHGINAAARERGITVLLTGQAGNYTFSYSGLELLPERLSRGQLWAWRRDAGDAVVRGAMRWRGAVGLSIEPWAPEQVWRLVERLYYGPARNRLTHTAISPTRLAELGVHPRPPVGNAVEMRLQALARIDLGVTNKGVLAGWGVDQRDPTADVRLIEFCLRTPTDQFLHKGQLRSLARRALAGRVPAAVLNETRRGVQAADWHESLTASRTRVADELAAIAACPAAARPLDLPLLNDLVAHWPQDGWEQPRVFQPYRDALLRALAAGNFARRVAEGRDADEASAPGREPCHAPD